MLQSIIINFILFGGWFSILASLGQLVVKVKQRENTYFSALFFFVGVTQIQFAYIISGAIYTTPELLTMHLSVLNFAAPLLYFIYYNFLYPNTFPKRIVLYLIPGIISIIADITFIFIPAEVKITLVNKIYFSGFKQDAQVILIKLLYSFAGLHFLPYLFFLGKKLLSIWNTEGLENVLKAIFGIICSTIIILILLIVGYCSDSIRIFSAGAFLISFGPILAYFGVLRYPEKLKIVISEAKTKQYERSLLEGINVNEVTNKLNRFMLDEKIYAVEDITLKKVADELLISPHQLSELLNEYMGLNFNSYINKFRIHDAMELLINEPKRSILSIAYAVGFNSKSSFYEAFFRNMGKTPSRYRKEKGIK